MECFIIASGMVAFLLGLLVRLGVIKVWFVMGRVPAIIVPSFAFGFMPAGLAFIVMGLIVPLTADIEVRRNVFLYVSMPLLGLSFLFTVWQPRWLLPRWYRWLKDEHGDILPVLEREAKQMSREQWHYHSRTQESLEAWVEGVRRKRELARADPKSSSSPKSRA